MEAILAAAKQKTRGGHSPIYAWLWKHYDLLAVELAPPISPNWAAMAEQFGKDGILDGSGKTPTAITVRQTYAKVARDKAAAAAGTLVRKRRGRQPAIPTAAAPAPLAPTDTPPKSQASAPLPPSPDDNADDFRTPLRRTW